MTGNEIEKSFKKCSITSKLDGADDKANGCPLIHESSACNYDASSNENAEGV